MKRSMKITIDTGDIEDGVWISRLGNGLSFRLYPNQIIYLRDWIKKNKKMTELLSVRMVFDDGVICDRNFQIDDLIYDPNFLVFASHGSANAYWKPSLKRAALRCTFLGLLALMLQ